MKHVFILGYNRAQYLSNWWNQVNAQQPFSDDTKFYYIDNGQQSYRDDFLNSILLHETESTIFCAGGWNLIAHYAFELLGLEKIIIGQEDAIFTQEIVDAVWNNTTPTNIQGTYDRSFEFSLFGLHQDVYKTVGEFDENFIQAGCEDNDYKHRCKMKGITIGCLGVSANYNESSTSEIRKNLGNEQYIFEKWGHPVNTDNRVYEYREPFNGNPPNWKIRPDYITYCNLPTDTIDFKSIYERNRANIPKNHRTNLVNFRNK